MRPLLSLLAVVALVATSASAADPPRQALGVNFNENMHTTFGRRQSPASTQQPSP